MANDLKTVRIVASGTAGPPGLKTVNVASTQKNPGQWETCLQATPTQAAAKPGEIPTYIASGGYKAGLKTIYISGYSGPN
jgi:hypothetical protein